jgi:SpoVK/Ycf46/Vps4 family AAA+-type ATPase
MLKRVEKHGFAVYMNAIVSWFQQDKLGSYSMDSLVGYDEVKQSLTNDAKKLFSKKSTGFSSFSPEHTLMYGPPGCGKTKLALSSVKELGAYYINESISSLEGAPHALNGFFRIARSNPKSVIILDEVEQLSVKTAETDISQLTNCMLSNLDGAEDNKGLLVIGITNYPWVMDPALLRAGRFSKRIFVGPPSDSERELLFKHYLKDFKTKGLDFKELVEKTNHYSCADVKQVAFHAGRLAFKKNPDSEEAPVVGMSYLLKAIEETPSTIIYWAEKAAGVPLPDYARKYFPGMVDFLKKYSDDNFRKGVPPGMFS